MRRSDMASATLKLGPDVIETTFPVNGDITAAQLGRVKIEVWAFDGCGYADANLHPGVIYAPKVWSPGSTKQGPVDACGVGGSVMVPVFRPVFTDWPQPPIPVVNDQPVEPGAFRRHGVPLLTYPAFRMTPNGELAIRWDQKVHALPRGRYEARVLIDGIVCGIFEIDKRYEYTIGLDSMYSADIEQPQDRGTKPEGVTDMFDEIYDWTSVTTCQLNSGDTRVSVKDAGPFATVTLCKKPQLVIMDGVTREIVQYVGYTADNIMQIVRSGTAPIQSGAIIRFEWTPDNVTTAVEGC